MNSTKLIRKCFLRTGILLALVMSVHAQSSLTNGLVAYYPFGGNAVDASGNENNGTVSNAVLTTDRFGASSNAYLFNGSSSYISVLSNDSLQLTNDLTISSWVNFQGNNYTFYDFLTKHRVNSNGEGTWVFNVGGGKFQFAATPYFDGIVGVPAPVPTNAWHQYLVTYSKSSQRWNVYLDGVLTNSGTRSYNIQKTDYDLVIGAENNPGANPPYAYFLKGALDDIRLYNRALSSNEVATLYAEESGGPQITTDLTNLAVLAGSDVTLAVAVTNSMPSTAPFGYQWYFTNSNPDRLAGAYAQVAGGFVYNAVVTNGGYGYGAVPSVSFVGGGGIGAAGYATISNGVWLRQRSQCGDWSAQWLRLRRNQQFLKSEQCKWWKCWRVLCGH